MEEYQVNERNYDDLEESFSSLDLEKLEIKLEENDETLRTCSALSPRFAEPEKQKFFGDFSITFLSSKNMENFEKLSKSNSTISVLYPPNKATVFKKNQPIMSESNL